MIEIFAFGSFQIAIDGQTVPLPNRKAQALLSYLASNSDQAHERAVLAEMFWPELPEAGAFNNLSKALGRIRKVFKLCEGGLGVVEATRRTIQLSSSSAWRFDVNEFNQLVAQAGVSSDTADCLFHLEQAVALYRGEFLAGLSLEECQTFDGWLLLQRENLMLMAREGYQRLADRYLEQGDFEAARNHARNQLALDAWHEEAHRQLMRALAGMGQRGDALAQYESCRAILRRDLGLEPERATRTVYEQIKAGQIETEAFTQTTATQPPAARLPKRLLPLIGRKRALRALKKEIANPHGRLITIMGPGGVGKTSLALEAAWQISHDFNHGAVFVPLEQLQPSAETDLHELLASSIGRALELSFSGRDPVHQQLFRQLSDKEMLLLLDNFEHLLAAHGNIAAAPCAMFLTSLMEHAPGIKVLVTSREQFAIPAEIILPLEGLPVPAADTDLPAIAEFSSVRLFVEQARRNQRDFRLTPANATAVVAICRLVDGLPLGIELAARWVSHLDCSEIAAAIQENWDFLVAETPQVTARHQSIRATFTYSWQMLDAAEQQMLAQLSIIPGRFNHQAALAITEGSLGSLVRLQGKSLLRQARPGTYSLHSLLHQFVAEKLAEKEQEALGAVRRRYSAYYLGELARQGEGFNQAWTGEAIKEIARNIDNIRCAWQMALDMGYFDLIEGALQPLYHYYRIQGLFHEARQVFSHAVALFKALHGQEKENQLWEELLGRMLLRLGRLAWFLANAKQAALLLREGLAHLQRVNARCDLSRGHAYLGEALLRAGQRDKAGPLLERALGLYRREGDNFGTATTLELQAVSASQAAEFDTADRLFQESIALSRGSGNRRLEGRTYHDWGLLLMRRGQIEQAAGLFADSQVIARELELRMPIAFNHSLLARCDRHYGDYDRARQQLLDSIQVLEESGYASYAIGALNMLGEVNVTLGETAAAAEALKKSLAQLRGMDTAVSSTFEYLALDFLIAAAYLFAHTGREAQAHAYLRQVQQYVTPESDLGQRAEQLSLQMTENESPTAMGSETSLSELLVLFKI